MENKEIPIIELPPASLQRIEKLKIYAILSGEKGEALIAIKDKLVLSLILAYNDSEAVMGARKLVERVGRKPEEYQVPFLFTKADIERLLPGIGQQMPDLVEGGVEASPNEIINYVIKVFRIAGTPTQMKVANAVVDKYKKHVKYLPKIPYEFTNEAN